MKYLVEISDDNGDSCRIRLSLPLNKARTNPDNSTWHVVDEGCLKYRGGGCQLQGYGVGQPADLQLARGGTYGVVFYEFLDGQSWANDSGTGWLFPRWATGLK